MYIVIQKIYINTVFIEKNYHFRFDRCVNTTGIIIFRLSSAFSNKIEEKCYKRQSQWPAIMLLSAGQSLGIYFSHPRAISQTPVVTSDLRGAYVRIRVESEPFLILFSPTKLKDSDYKKKIGLSSTSE